MTVEQQLAEVIAGMEFASDEYGHPIREGRRFDTVANEIALEPEGAARLAAAIVAAVESGRIDPIVPDGKVVVGDAAFSVIAAAMAWCFPDTMPVDSHHPTANLVAAAERLRDAMTGAPCSGQRSDPHTCFTCGHDIADHNDHLVCQLCDVPESFICNQSADDELPAGVVDELASLRALKAKVDSLEPFDPYAVRVPGWPRPAAYARSLLAWLREPSDD